MSDPPIIGPQSGNTTADPVKPTPTPTSAQSVTPTPTPAQSSMPAQSSTPTPTPAPSQPIMRPTSNHIAQRPKAHDSETAAIARFLSTVRPATVFPTDQTVSPSNSLRDLANGQKLPAHIIGSTEAGETIMRTRVGTLVGHIMPPPDKNTQILLQVLNMQNGIQVKILPMVGQPMPQQSPITLSLTRVDLAQVGHKQNTSSTANLVGQTFQGYITPTQTLGKAEPNPVVFKIIGFQDSTAGQTKNSGHPIHSKSAAANSGALAPTSSSVRASTPSVHHKSTAGQTAMSPPIGHQVGQNSSAPSTNLAGSSQNILATVLGVKGRTLTARSPQGMISLPVPQTLVPPGTVLELQMMNATSPYSAAARLAALQNVSLLGTFEHLSTKWQTMDKVLVVLRDLDLALAQQVQSRLPGMGPKLAENLILFIATMGRGSIWSLLGKEVAQTLERAGQQNLIRQLGNEFTQMSRISSDGVNLDWRTILFPFYDGTTCHQVQMYVERRSKHKNRHTPAEGMRFIIGLEFSTMGAVQLDGRIRDDLTVVELALRSVKELAGKEKEDIGEIFRSHLEAVGWVGTLTFVVSDTFPLDPKSEIVRARNNDYVSNANSAVANVSLNESGSVLPPDPSTVKPSKDT